jgi:hypothetical protein
MKRIYTAARYDRREEICGYAGELRAMGYEVECRWLLGSHQLHPGASLVDQEHHPSDGITMEAAAFALDDYEDLRASDTILLFSEPPETYSKRGGRHVEFGMALAWGKECIVIGPRENVFHCLSWVKRYPDWEKFKETLTGEK